MLSFTCGCGHALKVSNDLAGWTTKCPGCKQLIPVPSPDEPEPVAVERPAAASIPWKGIAIGASCVAVLAILIAVASMGGSSPDPEAVAENDRLKRQVSTLDREVDELRAKTARADEAAKLADRLKAVEADRDRIQRDLAAALARAPEPRRNAEPVDSTPTTAPTAASSRPPEGSADAEVAPVTPEEIQEKYKGAVVTISTLAGPAGGFFIQQDGLVVTRYSAVAGSDSRLISYLDTSNGKRVELEAEVVAVDEKNDLALLKALITKLVPVVRLETQFALGGGQELTVVGNPLPGSGDFSLLRGKVVDIWNPAENKPFIRMSIPITKGHAGAPVFNAVGRVVGVARIPDDTGVGAGLAVPTAHVLALVEGRETKFAVRGPFKEWETKRKVTEGGFVASAEAPPGSIAVVGLITKFFVDEEKDRIVGLDVKAPGVVVISLSKRKVLRTINTGPQPTDLQLTGNPDVVWVGHSASGNLVKVEVEEGRIFDKVTIPGGYDLFAASRNHIWGNTRGVSFLLTLKDKQISGLPLNFSGVGHDRRRDVILGLATYKGLTKMIELDPDKTGPILRDLADIKADPSNHPKRADYLDIQKDVEGRLKSWTPPPDLADWHGKGFRSRVVLDRGTLVMVNRSVLKKDRLDTIVATFAKEPNSRLNDPEARTSIALFGSEYQPIIAGSPDGRWVATMTHIFDVEKGAAHMELPIVTPDAAFSEDSKKVFVYDVRYSAIVPIDLAKK